MTIGVFIPALNATRCLPFLLGALLRDSCRPKILVCDCSSEDGTERTAASFGVETFSIPRLAFNHGLTREVGRKRLGTDIVVMMSQDSRPERDDLLRELVRPIIDGEAAVAYGRQLPRPGAGFAESFRRQFNYPERGEVRGIRDVTRFGYMTFFCSNSCAAYSSPALDDVGGFRRILSHEDYCTAARLLVAGYRIAYVPSATVVHSHHWTLAQEFRRAFDAGHMQAEHPWLTEIAGHADRRGLEFVRECLGSAWREEKKEIPQIVAQSLIRWLGYRAGCSGEKWLPLALKGLLSNQPGYFSRAVPPFASHAMIGTGNDPSFTPGRPV